MSQKALNVSCSNLNGGFWNVSRLAFKNFTNNINQSTDTHNPFGSLLTADLLTFAAVREAGLTRLTES